MIAPFGTYQFGITNFLGVSNVFQTYDSVAHIPPPPDEAYFLITLLRVFGGRAVLSRENGATNSSLEEIQRLACPAGADSKRLLET
jgi:hypothetical protein